MTLRRVGAGLVVVATGALASTALARGSDFTSSVNRICAGMVRNSPSPPNSEHPTARQWVRFLVPLQVDLQAGYARLAKLTPPARLKPHFTKFLAAGRSFVAALPRLVSWARQGKAAAVLQAFNAMPQYDAITRREAIAMGLKQCTQ